MKFSLEQMQKYTVGAIKVTQDDGVFNFHRFTPEQLQAFANCNEGVGRNAKSTTGMRLDFETDSKTLTVCALVQNAKYEVLVNGTPIHRQVLDQSEQTFTVDLGCGNKRVTLTIPSHTVGALKSVEIEDGAIVKEHKYDCKALFIGDSITQGWNSKYDSLSWAYRMSFYLNANSMILGVGGAYYNEESFPDVQGFEPDIVFIKFGTNDYGHFKVMDEALNQQKLFLQKAVTRYAKSKIYVITPIHRLDANVEKPMGKFDEFRKKLHAQAQTFDVTVIDGNEILSHDDMFFADALHPNDLGFGFMAMKIAEKIK